VASTTWEEYYERFEKDRALMRRFHRLGIDEPTAETTEKILIGLSPRLEQFHNVMIDTDAMSAAVELSVRYIHDKKNPDKNNDGTADSREGKDIAHVKALSKGGSNKDGTKVQSPTANRSFKRNSQHKLVTETSTKERKKK
jgi:ATP-dependent Clp protease ATP-binding subunit ClpA